MFENGSGLLVVQVPKYDALEICKGKNMTVRGESAEKCAMRNSRALLTETHDLALIGGWRFAAGAAEPWLSEGVHRLLELPMNPSLE